MLENAVGLLPSLIQQPILAQVLIDPVSPEATIPPEVASLIFSGPHFWVALLAGVMMAFGFQFLLTNLSLAFVISPVGDEMITGDLDQDLGHSIRHIETKVGLWALSTASIALFIACFLAVKLSLVTSTFLGVIIGVVIWSIYFSLFLWIGSSAVGSVLGALVSTATAGVQGLMGTAATAMGTGAARSQAVSTAADITAAVRRELTAGVSPDAIQTTLQNALATVQIPKLNLNEIRQQFDKILSSSDLKDLTESDLLKNVDRQTWVDLISSRTDFSPETVDQIADQLESAWKSASRQQLPFNLPTELLQFFQPNGNGNGAKNGGTSNGGAKNGGTSNGEINGEINGTTKIESSPIVEPLKQLVAANLSGKGSRAAITTQVLDLGIGALLATLQNKVNLADPKLEKLTDQLQQVMGDAMQQVGQQVGQLTSKAPKPASPIQADVEHYVMDSFPWHLNRLTIEDEFREVLYDPNADPSTVRQQLEALHPDNFKQLLTRRGDLSSARVEETTELMENIRQELLVQVRQAEAQEQFENLKTRLENYLRATGKEELHPEAIAQNLHQILSDPEAGVEQLEARFGKVDRAALFNLLQQRQDLDEAEIHQIVSQFEQVREQVVNAAREFQEQTNAKAAELRQKVEDYLRQTDRAELNPEAIRREFQTLWDDPQAGLAALRTRLSQFDRDTLVQLLSQRQDLSEEQVNQVIDQILAVRDNILQTPRRLASEAQAQYDQTLHQIAEYLRNTNLEALDPEGIQRDLKRLFSEPQTAASALRERLSQVDRDTLVQLLSQRPDLSEEQVNRAIDQVEAAIRNLVRAPQRLASRGQKRILDFEANLESYLRNTQKEELNPEKIRRDLKLLLNHPKAGLHNITERLSQFDRSTLIALLSQREDISEAEANQIVDQILATRDTLVEQAQHLQQRAQAALDNTFERIRTYLNSLDRPELNYEGIQQDFVTLFDDPQLGLDALRQRLSQFDRETLIALLSSRPDISPADAERIVGQVEAARDQVLHQAEQIQQEVQQRLTRLKQQAQQQAIETRKVTAGAAWWLFGTGLASLTASAIAGAIAVSNGLGLGI